MLCKVELEIPKMRESLQEDTIIKWIKNVGDKVEQDEIILEISTDKVDTEVLSPLYGTIVEILAEENEVVKVGDVIARIAIESGEPVLEMPKRQDVIQEQEPIVSRKLFEKAEPVPNSIDGKFFSPLIRSITENGNDMIAIRSMLYVSITYDHRVIDGMLAGQCLGKIADSLENMNSLTIELY